MRRFIFMTMAALGIISLSDCSPEKKIKDRSHAHDMFEQITSLTIEYTKKVEATEDSASWEAVCLEYEDSLDKINFHYPADTDLLLSEGQNDTIMRLTEKYVKARDKRIQTILHPLLASDTVDTISKARFTTRRSFRNPCN
ncbi:MAG: hypothetical protein NC095_05755 [Muribaculum sp.]|nr:hypothetical protein [Muribaculum sp.]